MQVIIRRSQFTHYLVGQVGKPFPANLIHPLGMTIQNKDPHVTSTAVNRVKLDALCNILNALDRNKHFCQMQFGWYRICTLLWVEYYQECIYHP